VHAVTGIYGEHTCSVALTVFVASSGRDIRTMAGSFCLLSCAGSDSTPPARPAPSRQLVDVTGLVIYFSVASVICAEPSYEATALSLGVCDLTRVLEGLTRGDTAALARASVWSEPARGFEAVLRRAQEDREGKHGRIGITATRRGKSTLTEQLAAYRERGSKVAVARHPTSPFTGRRRCLATGSHWNR